MMGVDNRETTHDDFSALYEDTSNHTDAYKIFNYYYEVQIPASFANVELRALMGEYKYDRRGAAEQEATDMIRKRHTIAELTELNMQGARIILMNPKDSVVIYNTIQDYLKKRRHDVKYSLSTGEVNLTDLSKLDAFAKSVYHVARQYEQRDLGGTAISRNINALYGNRRLTSRIKERQDEIEAPREQPKHRSILDEISHDAIVRDLPYR
jgi:hypothetical protein